MAEVGRSRRAGELERLIRGKGQYVADLQRPGLLHLAFVRSPHAHARVRGIDASQALAAPGVVDVLTAADLPASVRQQAVPTAGEVRAAPRPVLAADVVHCVGAPVAAVVAESAALAIDAAARVEVDYEPLPAVTDVEEARAPAAPLVHPKLGSNVAYTARRGGDVDEAFARAARVASLRLAIPRIAGVPMEPLGVLAEWEPGAERLTVWCTTQAPWRVHSTLVGATGLPEAGVRVVSPDVGGGFGVRGPVYGEYVVAALAARRVGRPVRWTATRQEDFLVTQSARETIVEAELAASEEGQLLGLRVRCWINLGAYASPGGGGHLSYLPVGAYRIPAAQTEVSGVYTNTNPTGAYRGAGRPEAAYVIERLLDELAAVLGQDPAELRRRNFIPADAFPHTTPLGATYDSGNYAAPLDRALELVGYERLRAEQGEARTRTLDAAVSGALPPLPAGEGGGEGETPHGAKPLRANNTPATSGPRPHPKPLPQEMGQEAPPYVASLRPNTAELIGVGLMSYIEPTGGGWEAGRVRIEPDGRAVAITGSVAHGQTHRTTFAQIVADRLGVRFEDVEVRQGDTADGLPGIGSFGSRSTALGGGGLAVMADEVFRRGRQIAAHLLEAAPGDVVARAGRFAVVGVTAGERSVSWAEVAAAAASGRLPAGLETELDAQTKFDMHGATYAFGTCVAVVGIDPATGAVRLRRLALVHDCGTEINPKLVEAQLHGGLTQGAGEALGEWLAFGENGQLLAGSLLDYWVPRADDLPAFETGTTATPSPLNALGAKGVGEAGTIAAPAAIANAVLDALRPLGVRTLDLPFTPERVWSAIRNAKEDRTTETQRAQRTT